MPTSSITKNFVVSGKKQVDMFANALEESYQESLKANQAPDMKVSHLSGLDDVRKFFFEERGK